MTKLKDQVFGQAPNDYQRQRLGPILDAHFAVSADGIARHAGEQRAVYGRSVAIAAIETSRADAAANPANLSNAMARAEDATRFLYQGQAPEVVGGEVRKAGGLVVSAAIGSLLARNDPSGVRLFQQYRDRLDAGDRHRLGAAAEMLSNSLDAAGWLRDCSATLAADKTKAQPPQGAAAPTGDAALDAVNAPTASATEPPPVTSSGGLLLPQDGVAGYGQRLAEIEDRRRALTALNEREFADNPARLRANRTAIETDSARGRAAVKAEADGLYAELRRYLTTGGPGGGRAVAPPPAMLLSRFTDAQQASIARQVDRAIAGQPPATDPQTEYAIRQRLTGDDAVERERWASSNLVQFMDRLSDEDYAALERLQTVVRSNDGGAATTRLQIINRMANQALRTAGIDPTPRPDAAPDSDAAQAATFHRALQDELSVFESSKGRAATAAEAYDIVNGLKNTGIKGGWLKVGDRPASPTVTSDIPPTDDALPFTANEIAGMRRTLGEGTTEERAAVLTQYEALPEDMEDLIAEKLVTQTAEPRVMSDATDEELQDGQQYAQASPPRAGARGGGLRPLTPRQEAELMEYRSKVDVIRRLDPQNPFAGPRVTTEDSPISRRQMQQINEELVKVEAEAARRDLEREERERGETASEPLPSADDLVLGTVPGGFLSRSPSGVPDRAERGTSFEAPRSIVQTLQERELAKTRERFHLSKNSPTSQRILENLDRPFGEFTGLNKAASIWEVLPRDMQSWTVRQVLESGNSMARKLLMQKRFDK